MTRRGGVPRSRRARCGSAHGYGQSIVHTCLTGVFRPVDDLHREIGVVCVVTVSAGEPKLSNVAAPFTNHERSRTD